MSDLFKEENQIQTSWMKWTEVGQEIEGTLVAVRRVEGKEGFGPQVVYEIKTKDGYVNVPFSETKTGVIDRMRAVKEGMIVGFKYTKEVPAKTKGYANAKVIDVFSKQEYDPEYQAEQLGGKVVEEGDEEIAVDAIPFT